MDECLIHAVQNHLSLQFWSKREIELLYSLLKGKTCLSHPMLGVFLTKEHEFGPVNVMAYWDREKKRVRYAATSRRACRATLNWGKRRSWIEATFKDFKSGGFQLESSKLTKPERMNRLLLVMAITYLWCYHVGRWVFKTGRRRQVDTGSRRNHSFFRMGLDWLIQAIPLSIQDFKVGLLSYSSQSDP